MFWLWAADFWWVAPSAIAAGGLGAFGLHRLRRTSARRLAYEAARVELAEARKTAAARRSELKAARAEVGRLIAERAATRSASVDVAGARRTARQAEKAVKAADATVRALRARLAVARHELAATTDAADYPLVRVTAAHDAVTARWLDYETDPAKLIAYPAMSDVRSPETKVFLDASERTRWLRPTSAKAVTPAEFARYRDAVVALEQAFEAAERAAKARANGAAPAASDPQTLRWHESAQEVLSRSAEALDRAAEVAASALAAWNRKGKQDEKD